jgi:hypothetical protein
VVAHLAVSKLLQKLKWASFLMPFSIIYHMSILSQLGDDGCQNGSMGFNFGLEDPTWRRPNRWLFYIPGVSADGAPALPPKKSARPSITMKEEAFQHISEVIYFPLKAEWKPLNITLYDIRCNQNVIFSWLSNLYNSNSSSNITFALPLEGNGVLNGTNGIKIPQCTLELYDGCGKVIETWIYENVYPSEIQWGELDMDNNAVVMVDLTLRYDRAYFVGQ